MRKTWFAFASSLALCTLSSPGWAADPVVAGTTTIGTHPSYGSYYSAFWRSGGDYALLTDNYHTFVNAPNQDGAVFLRAANADVASFQRSQVSLYKDAYFYSWLIAAGSSSFTGPVTTYGGLSSYGDLYVVGDVYSYNDIQAYGPASFYGDTILTGSTTLSGDTWLTGSTTVTGGLNVQNTPEGGGIHVSQSDYTGNYAISLNGRGASMYVEADIQVNRGYKPGGGPWLSSSDRRVKKDIVDYRPGLAEIERVHAVRYRYNGLGGTVDSGKEYVGVIAQELESVAPYMVNSAKKKLRATDTAPVDLKEVDPNAFTYMLINAVQELSQQNKELKKVMCQDHPAAALCGHGNKRVSAIRGNEVR
jgi:hypothetical protein